MPEPTSCPNCGTPWPTDAPPGVCLACELRNALDAEDESSLPPETEDFSPEPPRTLGDYELLEAVGHGGMGTVYRAHQASLDRLVAVKLLPFGALTNPTFVKRFRAEAAAAAGLQHPNIVTVHEVGVHQGQHYLVMNYLKGPPLSRLVAEGPLPARRAAAYLKTVSEAVHHAHEQGILHRDLKPSNVLTDENDQPLVTDFGLARRLDGESTLTLTGHVLGSPSYMPPEQAAGVSNRISRRTDVYGLGATLYHLLTGRPPFQAASLSEALYQVQHTEPAPPRLLNAAIPRDLETICLKCLEKEPDRRYPTARLVAEDLARFLEGQPVHARPVGPAGRTWRWCRRRPVQAGLAAAFVLTFLAGLAGMVWQWRRSQEAEWFALQNAYAADIHQAQVSLDEGDLGTALQLLNRYQPGRVRGGRFGSRAPADLRGWEWRYLWQLCQGDEVNTLHRYASSVGGLAVTPNGSLLAVQKGDGHLAVWDLPGRREITNLPASGKRGAMAISPDGRRLAAANWLETDEREVVLWILPTLQVVHRMPHPAPVMSLAFSPDGTVLATQDSQEEVRVWSLETGEVRAHLEPEGQIPWMSGRWPASGALQFSPDGAWLAFPHLFSGVRVVDWRHQTNALVRPPSQEASTGNPILHQVTSLAFAPDGRLFAWGSGDGVIRLTRLSPGEAPSPIEIAGRQQTIHALRFTPDSRRLISAGGDQTIQVWDVATQAVSATLRGNESEVWALALLPDGHTLISGGRDGSVRQWDLDAPPAQGFPRQIPVIFPDFTADGRQFVALDARDEEHESISLWDARTAQKLETLTDFGTNHYIFDLSPDDRWFVTAGRFETSIEVWDWATRRQITEIDLPAQAFALGFSAGGSFLGTRYYLERPASTAGRAREGRAWRTGSWERMPFPQDGTLNVSATHVTKDDRLWALGLETGEIYLRRLPDGRHLRTLTGYRSRVEDLETSPDGRWLAAAAWEDAVRLWDLQRGDEWTTVRSRFTHNVSVCFSPDGSRLVVGGLDGGDPEPHLMIWDLATGRELLTLSGAAFGARFSPDGATLVAEEKGQDWKTLLWRAPAWEEIRAREDTHRLR